MSAALVAQRDHLLALVRRRAGARVDAEEVVHVALERALARVAQLRDPARAQAWIGRIVRNAVSDELRRRREAALPMDAPEQAAGEDDHVGCWCVLTQMGCLKAEYAQVLRRVVVEGLPLAEVAAELGLTANNATVRLHRARRALRARLAAHCGTTTALLCSECGCMERGCCPLP